MRTLGQAANLCIRCASNKKTTCGDGIDAIRHHVNVANGDQLDHSKMLKTGCNKIAN